MEKTIESGLNWNHAENMRKQNRFADALPIFVQYFNEHHDEPTLWRCIHCARHLKDYKTAIELIENNYRDFTDSEMLRVQFAWLKYDAFMPGMKKRSDWEGILRLADEILALNPEDGEILFRLTIFAAIDAARNLNDYQKMLELTDMIGPEKLAAEGEQFKGRRMISWRERWYFARLHALFSAQLYNECRALAFKAFAEYPRKIEFARKAALCKEKLGVAGDAEEELMAISKVKGSPWYVLADLARIRFEMKKYDEALDAAYGAAVRHGEDKTKVNLFALIAKILLIMGDTENALNHVVLSCSIRNREHWKTPEELQQLRDRLGIGNELPAPELARKKCSEIWQPVFSAMPAKSNGSASGNAVSQRESGKMLAGGLIGNIGEIKENRNFAFINTPDNPSPVFVRQADVPESLWVTGARVTFDLIESFDQKKGVVSVRAVAVKEPENLAQAA